MLWCLAPVLVPGPGGLAGADDDGNEVQCRTVSWLGSAAGHGVRAYHWSWLTAGPPVARGHGDQSAWALAAGNLKSDAR